MKIVSNAYKTIADTFASEGLAPPAVLPWPLDGGLESDRLLRERRFAEGPAATPPPGLSWITAHAPAKYDPEKTLSGARSILVTYLPYFRDDPADAASVQEPPPTGRVARYARGRDYHRELGGRLKKITRTLLDIFPGQDFRGFTDIGPLDETWLAQASGLGFKGRHTLAILPEFGSWVVLGHIVSTLPLEASPGRPSPMRCPDGCTRCIDACPTGALSLPGVLDAGACLSYRTIEHKGEAPPEWAEQAGSWLFGCDACQESCPFNARVLPTEVGAFLNDIAGPQRRLEEVLSIQNHQEMTRLFAGSPLMRAGRNGLVRNACLLAGNSGDKSLLPLLEKLSRDKDPGIAQAASEATVRLRRS